MAEDKIEYKQLILVPAIITLAVTLLRLVSEFLNLPGWLASKEAGGAGALIGITWLAPLFGVYFAYKLAGRPGSFIKNLAKTMFAYGLAARIPVIVIMGFAIFGDWGTHYDAFPEGVASMSPMMQFIFGAVVTQIVVWAGVWTTGIGTLVGFIATKFKAPTEVTT